MSAPRISTLCAVLACSLAPGHASAFAAPERFAQPAIEAGGGGRYFTGSVAEGFSCNVCHEGGEPLQVFVYGLPHRAYVPDATYEVALTWPRTADKVSLALELTDAQGEAAGSVQLLPRAELSPSDFCEPADAQIEAAVLHSLPDGRSVVGLPDCGAEQLRMLWTTPSFDVGPVWFTGSILSSDGQADMAGDGVTNVERAIPSPSSASVEASTIAGSCSIRARVSRPCSPLAAATWLGVAFGLRRRGVRRRAAASRAPLQ